MKELDKKLIIDNGFWKVFQTFSESKNGRKGNVITMAGTKNDEGVIIFGLTKQIEVIYINEYRPGPQKEMLMFVAGSLEKGEDPKIGALRELREETGYVSNNFKFLGEYIHNGYIQGKIYLAFAVDCEKSEEPNLQDIEEIEVFTISIEGFEQMLKNNEINCPWSELAFRKAKELTNNFTNFNF